MKRRLPSPSMIVACVALAVALGGTSYAALSKNSVGSKEIKKGAVKAQELAPNSVTSPKVKDRSLKEDDFAKGELPQGPAGPPGPPGAPNPSADTLDGVDSKGFSQVRSATSLNYAEQSPLTIDVSGYGTFRLRCVANEVSLGLVKDEGTDGIASGSFTTSGGTGGFFQFSDTPENQVFEGNKGAQISGVYRHTEAGGGRTVVVEFGATEDPADETCAGHLIARSSG
jgi:hypothetical protein